MSPRRRPPRPPLPVRDGLGPVRIRLRESDCVGDELIARFGSEAVGKLERGEIVDAAGRPVSAQTRLSAGTVLYTYRETVAETPVPFVIDILYRDADIVVVDKPHFLSTMPRGRHVAETALVRLRRDLNLPELAPAHRLDRLTAGVLLFTVRPEVRAAYHSLFASRRVHKVYDALAPIRAALALPTTVHSRIVKRRGVLQAVQEEGPVNAETRVELVGPVGALARYRLEPATGQTHQLRVHMNALGIPIVNDPLYPVVTDVPPDDFSRPLRLVARSLSFPDPFSGKQVRFESMREL